MKTPKSFGLPLSSQFVNSFLEPTSQGEVQTLDIMQMSKGDAFVYKKHHATIVPQVKSFTTSHNTQAHRKLTPLQKSKQVHKQLS
jgi:hypothetical protein